MNLREYFFVIGYRLIMDFYVGHSIRDFFLKNPITPQKGTPICLNKIISGRRLEKITQVMYYKNIAIHEFNDPFFQQRQMQEGWNKNTAAHFETSWVSILDVVTDAFIMRHEYFPKRNSMSPRGWCILQKKTPK